MRNYTTGNEAFIYFLFVHINISNIPCLLGLSLSNFEAGEFTFEAAAIILLILFILTILSSEMHPVFNLDEFFESKLTWPGFSFNI